MRHRQRTWIFGGAGLITCGVVGMLQTSLVGVPGADIINVVVDAIYAASVLLFAIGLSRAASVVARGPLGVAAMTVVALWPLVSPTLTRMLADQSPAEEEAWTAYGYLSLLVPTAAALIAGAQIARARSVPSPWCWAPLWVLGAYAATWAIPQIIFVTVRADGIQEFGGLFTMLGGLATLAGTIGIGILAIVLAARERPESVEIYRSA